MRIAIDARSYGAKHFTGIGRYIAELIHALERIDTDDNYTVVLCDLNADEYEPKSHRFKVIVADARPYTVREQIVMPQLLHRLGADLVHFPANFGPLAYRGVRVTTVHDLSMILHPPSQHAGLRGRLETYRALPARAAMRRGMTASAAVITSSETTAEELRTRYRRAATAVHVAHAGVTRLREASAGYRSADLPQPPFLLFVGLCYPHKNLGRLLRAMVILKSTRPDLALVIAGRDDHAYRDTEALARRLGLEGTVHFPGRVDDEQLAWLYANAEAFVFPSLSEGFGLPGIEAMTLGTPVLAARASCLPEIYGDAAAYMDPHDEGAMAADIERLLRDPSALARLRSAGPRRAATFNWEDTAKATLAVYRSVVERVRAGTAEVARP